MSWCGVVCSLYAGLSGPSVSQWVPLPKDSDPLRDPGHVNNSLFYKNFHEVRGLGPRAISGPSANAKVRVVLSSRLGLYSLPKRMGLGHMVKETHMIGLDELRERLDIIDEQMMALLSERAKVVNKVADFKRRHNIPVYIPEREVSIIERLRALNPGPLSGDAVERIYRTIVEEMRKFESQGLPH